MRPVSGHAIALAVVVVGVAWVVGAYNRLVRLRADALARWAELDAALAARATQIGRLLDVTAASYPNAGARIDALRAASRQVDAAREHVRTQRAAERAVASLQVAQGIFADARSRLPAGAALDAGAAAGGGDAASTAQALRADLAAADAALGYATGAFDRASVVYSRAARQFPTLVVSTLFGFRPTGTLAAPAAPAAPA